MENQPQNPEFRNNPENFHPWDTGHIAVNVLKFEHFSFSVHK